MCLENGRLRAFFEHDENAQVSPIRALRPDIRPVEAQMQRRRYRHALGDMQDEALFHQGGVEIDDRVVLLRIDLADETGGKRIHFAERLAQDLGAMAQ